MGGGPPMGGGAPMGGPPMGGPPSSGDDEGGSSKKKIFIGIGVGCLLFSLIVCAVGTYMCNKAAEEATSGLQNFAAEANRFLLSVNLGAIQASCAGDPSGASTATYFHPQTFPQLQPIACQVTANTQQAFGDGTRSTASMLAGTADESRAAAVGADVNQCFLFTSGAAKVVGCTIAGEFKIVHMENPAGVQ